MKNIAKYILQKQKKGIESKNQETSFIDDRTIMHLFSRIIRDEYGRQGEKNILPTFYKNGVIFVKINNSIWAQELWIRRSFFIEALNTKVGREILKNIKIAS